MRCWAVALRLIGKGKVTGLQSSLYRIFTASGGDQRSDLFAKRNTGVCGLDLELLASADQDIERLGQGAAVWIKRLGLNRSRGLPRVRVAGEASVELPGAVRVRLLRLRRRGRKHRRANERR